MLLKRLKNRQNSMNKTNYGFIKTVDEREEIKSLIQELRESLFKKEGFGRILKNKVPLKYSPLINSYVKSTLGKEGFEGSLESLEEYLKNLKEINITLAFEPSEKTIDKIYTWVTKNVGTDVILNLAIQPDILGGAILSYKGLYFDYSLEKKLNAAFSEKREEIRKLYE